MKLLFTYLRSVALAGVTLLVVASAIAADAPGTSPHIVLVGDSTVASQSGWGDAFAKLLAPGVESRNFGRSGRSSKSYRAEGHWKQVLAAKPAWVLIQFGHNDQPGKPGRSTDLATEYPANLARYVADVRAAGGQPVLVTPLTRRTFKDGRLADDLQPWADAMRRVAGVSTDARGTASEVKVLADAVAQGQPIAVFEVVSREWPVLLGLLMLPVVVTLSLPLWRPFRWPWLLWCWVVPVVPTLVAVFWARWPTRRAWPAMRNCRCWRIFSISPA